MVRESNRRAIGRQGTDATLEGPGGVRRKGQGRGLPGETGSEQGEKGRSDVWGRIFNGTSLDKRKNQSNLFYDRESAGMNRRGRQPEGEKGGGKQRRGGGRTRRRGPRMDSSNLAMS